MKLTIALLFISFLSIVALGQTEKNRLDEKIKPDFTGVWILDEAKSKDVGYGLTLTVVEKDPEMKITKTYNFKGAKKIVEQIYYTDGRTVPDTPMGFSTVSQKSIWQSGKLVHTQQASRDGGKTIEQTITEKWELSADGKTLILTTNESGSVQSKNIRTGQTAISQADVTTVLKFKRNE
jgi:hypothetical protein